MPADLTPGADEIGAPILCRDHTQVVRNLEHLDHVGDRDSERVARQLSRQHCTARGES